MTFYISIHKGKVHLPVHLISPKLVRVSLPSDASPLELRREVDTWVMPGRRRTIARDAILRAWDTLFRDNRTLIEDELMKTEADPYVFVVDEHNRLFRLTKTQYNRFCSDVVRANVDPPVIDLAKYRAVEIGPAPVYLDNFRVSDAKLYADHNVVSRSKSETKRQTTLRVVPPPEEPQPHDH